MSSQCRFVAAAAAAVCSASAIGGSGVQQLDQFATGFSGGTPLLIPAIDPADACWHAPSNHLFIADSEIEEVSSVWNLIHANIFECSLSGGTWRRNVTFVRK